MVNLTQLEAKPGSHAVHRDNASISYWGDSVEVVRGNQRINASTPIPVITGDENDALGPADDRTISLGDGGQATYVFDREVSNIDGQTLLFSKMALSGQVDISWN